MRANKARYKREYNAVLHELEQRWCELRLVSAGVEQARVREQLLLEMLGTQEVILDLLDNKWAAVIEEHRQQQQSQQQRGASSTALRAQAPPGGSRSSSATQVPCEMGAACATAGSSSTSSDGEGGAGGSTNRVCRLLEAATPQQVRRALSMSADDWRALLTAIFQRGTVLLELLSREPALELLQGAPEGTGTPEPPAAAAGGARIVHLAGEALQDAETMICEYEQLAYVALLLNPTPLWQAVSAHLVTGEPAEPPAQHWRRAMERACLTPAQLLHLKATLGLHMALEHACRERGEAVVTITEQATAELEEKLRGAQHEQRQQGDAVGGTAHAVHEHASSGASASASGPAVAPDALPGSDRHLEQLLQRCTRRHNLTVVLLTTLLTNTGAPLQTLVAMVACFPFAPYSLKLMEAGAQMYDDRTHQQAHAHAQAQVQAQELQLQQLPSGHEPSQRKHQQQQQRQQQQQQEEPADAAHPARSAEPLQPLLQHQAAELMRRRDAELQAAQQQWGVAFVTV